MADKALFAGLIFDEKDNVVETAKIGSESFYVVDDDGFRRHIPSEQIDRQILKMYTDQIKGNEDYLSQAAADMMHQDDVFTVAILKKQLENIDKEIDNIFSTGIPEDVISYLGMMGTKICIDIHGNIISMKLPSQNSTDSDNDGENGE